MLDSSDEQLMIKQSTVNPRHIEQKKKKMPKYIPISASFCLIISRLLSIGPVTALLR